MGVISLSGGRTTSESIEIDPNFNETKHNLSVWFEVAAIFLLWLKLFYFLRIWNSTNYLARMIKQVFKDMKSFFVVFMVVHCGFG
jgi:hypothetical protein